MTSASESSAQPAPEQAYRWIRAHIVAIPRDEDAFLNEVTLATETNTSRTPVREALLRLESEGFLRRIPRKGAYVPQITDADLRALIEARELIECWAASSAAALIHKDLPRFEDLLERQRAEQLEPARFIELDIEFHGAMVGLAGNPVITDFYRSLRQRQLRIGVRAVSQEGGRAARVLAEHEAILDAIREGQEPTEQIQAHLESTLRAAIA